MIFISHTKSDKPIVEPIAVKLAEVFGKDNVFYDSWSIQPGDGIIDKMNLGLETSKFFFLFVSERSINSKMVSLEWQNALFAQMKGKIKVIPVKIDNCEMPVILLQHLYIDLFSYGFDVAIRQMIDVINGRNTYKGNVAFSNVKGYVSFLDNTRVKVEFKAEHYLEPISRYLICLENNLDNINYKCTSDAMYQNGKNNNVEMTNGQRCNALFVGVSRGTTPGFPFVVELNTINGEDVRIVSLMHATSDDFYSNVPMILL